MEADSADAVETARRLRDGMVDRLVGRGVVREARVTGALRGVARHVFLPGVGVAEAYADEAVALKADPDGVWISAASQPSMVAAMLGQLGVEPGQRVLEIGAGSGWHAALLAYLVGDRGRVTTVDVDEELAAGARERLVAAGWPGVVVRCGDGALGDPAGAPYDRIVATVGAHDVPDAWLEQLAPGGRLVVPLRVRGGVSRSVALVRDGGEWRADGGAGCLFMPLRGGIADDPWGAVPVGAGASVDVHREQVVDAAAVRGVLDGPARVVSTGVVLAAGESPEWLDLWLACALPNAVSRLAAERGRLAGAEYGWGAMATVAGPDLAWLTLRPAGAGGSEVGVSGHGPGGAGLAGRVADQVRAWARHRDREVTITLGRGGGGGADPDAGRFTVDTGRHRIEVRWDQAA
jgi:protein-L-isoaspartate(D-aspartate) O-methyltransferase